MENASKALIIAGAIVLSVLIVSLGFYFFNQSSGIGKSFNMTEYDIKSHNSQFESYEGTITGAQARELFDKVYQYNLSQGEGAGVIITKKDDISVNGTTYHLNKDMSRKDTQTGSIANEYMINTSNKDIQKNDLILGKYYTVKIFKDQNLGTIAFIKITVN